MLPNLRQLSRRMLGLVFQEGRDYRVPFGPLRGMRLHYERAVTFHAVMGLWESESFAFLGKVLGGLDWFSEPRIVADLGANMGYFSLWASRNLKAPSSRIYAFEPGPPVLSLLRRNLDLNDVRNVEVVEMACADKRGTLDFFVAPNHYTSSLVEAFAAGTSGARKVTVTADSLDSYFLGGDRQPPDLIKVDIEGAGVFAFPGMSGCVAEKQPLLWVESHSAEEDRAISDLIVKHDYGAYRLQTRTYVKDVRATHPDPNGVWGTLLLFPQALRFRLHSLLK